MKKLLLIIPLALLIFGCDLRKEKLDLILHNGHIYTLDDKENVYEAIGIKDGKIVSIGAEHQILNKYQAVKTLDLRGAFVYPGFIDAHSHFIGYAEAIGNIDLNGTQSWAECIERIKAFDTNGKKIILGRGWDQNDWNSKDYPTNEELNVLFPNTPVVLTRIDGHASIANDKALEIAKIDERTKIDGGEIILAFSKPTGVLIDNAKDYVNEKLDHLVHAVELNQLKVAEQHCFESGLTSVTDAGLNKKQLEALSSFYKDSLLSIGLYAMISDDSATLAHYFNKGPEQVNNLNIRSVKLYADGALGSRGACLCKPYHDRHNHYGFILRDSLYYDLTIEKMAFKGFQINTHCIGDSANRVLLNIYSNHLKTGNDLRWRIEHAQVVNPSDYLYFKNYNIIPSIQPTHATSDMYWAEDRLGQERIKWAYAYNDLKNLNGLVALGTDFPIEGISPLETFYSAVFRQDHEGYPSGGFNMENKMSRKDALKGMTIWNAIAQFEENTKGSLEIGKLADIVVLNYNLLTVPQNEFENIKVLYTIKDGRIQHDYKY